MIQVYEKCENCGEVIEENDEIIQLTIGVSRGKKHIFRYIIGSIFKPKLTGRSYLHINCIDSSLNYDDKNPHLTLEEALE